VDVDPRHANDGIADDRVVEPIGTTVVGESLRARLFGGLDAPKDSAT
jgi:hypothetical protein